MKRYNDKKFFIIITAICIIFPILFALAFLREVINIELLEESVVMLLIIMALLAKAL